jgi:uncharacterized LabA/DUF88 family protein
MAYVISTKSGDEQGFFGALEKIGIETRVKELQEFWGGAKKGDWDVGLAVDAITLAPKLDAIVLCTGDGDFVPLVEYLQRHMGTQVEVVSFGQSSSSKLKDAADDFFDLSLDPETYLITGDEKRPMKAPQAKKRGSQEKPGPRGEGGGKTRRAVSL